MEAWSEEDEPRLVRAAQAGDLRAFDGLVRRYRRAAQVIAASILGGGEAANDAVQDALIAAFKALPQLGDENRFAAWLGAIVRNRCMRLRAGERKATVPIDDVILAYVPAIAEGLVEGECRAEVRAAIERLAEDLRPVVRLYYLEDWSVGEISEFLHLPRTTVKWRLHAARQILKRELSDYEDSYARTS
jgi:RNA polymerase sigma-70 factor (ECF subfamily)